MSAAPQLIDLVADGRWHPGPELADKLGVTRATISARVRQLRAMGLDIYAVSGKGYRLARPLSLLSAQAIRQALAPAADRCIADIVVRRQVDSTNSELARCDDGRTRACFAEYQSTGRGRAGRTWVSPFASNLYVSLIHRLAAPPGPIGALSLWVALALANALEAIGAAPVGLKWPNDIWLAETKIGGILVDYRGEAGGAARLIVGVGLNVSMSTSAGAAIEQGWGRLADHLSALPSRNTLAADVLSAVAAGIETFETEGTIGLDQAWSRFDVLAGRAVTVTGADASRHGIACGINVDGSLQIETSCGLRRAYSGDVSVRPAP